MKKQMKLIMMNIYWILQIKLIIIIDYYNLLIGEIIKMIFIIEEIYKL